MPQLSLYLDDITMDDLRKDAQNANTSLSKYAAQAIRERHTSAWPSGFFDLYGSIKDESFEAPKESPWKDKSFAYDDFTQNA